MLTKGAIGNLINRYRAVLKKCRLLNVFGSLAAAGMIVLGGAGTAAADDATTAPKVPSQLTETRTLQQNDYSYQTGFESGNTELDLNGKKLTTDCTKTNLYDNKNDALIIINRGSSLTIKDNAGGGEIAANDLLCGVKLTYTGEGETGSKAVLTVESGTISSKYYAITGNGTRHGTEITINGGTIKSTGSADDFNSVSDPQGIAIYQPQDGTLTINGGVISGQKTGIVFRSGTLNITGGEITGQGSFKTKENGNGPTVSGAALAISQHSTDKAINVTIAGGTFTGEYAIYEKDFQNDKSDNISIDIQNGTFNGKIYSENVKDFISGGTFSDPTALNYLKEGADISLILPDDYTAEAWNYAIKNGTVTMELNDDDFTMQGVLKVETGGTLSIDLPGNGGISSSSDKALLALGTPLNLDSGSTLLVGNVSSDTSSEATVLLAAANDNSENTAAKVAFGADSILVVDGKVSSKQPMIKGSGSLSVADGSQLYIVNAQANTSYTITDGLTGDSYWNEANLMANRLIKSSVAKDGDAVMVKTEVKDVASALPGVIPVSGLEAMLAQNVNNTESSSMGIRFLSRATEPLYMSDDAKAVDTINEVSRAAAVAGVQNTSLRLADAMSDTVLHHLSLGNFDADNSIHKDGIDVWAVPMYGNTYTHGMAADASVHGNYGGLAIGADTQVGTVAGGALRVGLAVNGGGGKSHTSGTVTDIENSYNFGGVNLYAGWNLDNLNILGSLGYSMGRHNVTMDLPSSLGMGQAEADVYTRAFTADLRFEYLFQSEWLDVMPHVGVRYTALQTDDYDLEVNDSTLNKVETDMQNIVQFPIGVTVSKNFSAGDWLIKPRADVSFIPAVGDRKACTSVTYTGVNASDSADTIIMDAVSWSGKAGLQAENGNFAFSLNYGVQASLNETNHQVNIGFTWKF